MDINDVMRILDKLAGMDVEEAAVELDGAKIAVKNYARSRAAAPVQADMAAEYQQTECIGDTLDNEGKIAIKSPIAGIFYESPEPEAQSFVTVGQKVKKGDVLCILETMKLFNELKSEAEGTVAEVLVENGQQVEAGQVLFLIEEA